MPSCQVVHIGFEVLDDATLVGGSQIRPGVSEGEGADSCVMSLENSFKVEGESIPESELSARRAG